MKNDLYITPNDERVIGYDDSLSIQNAIKLAKFTGINTVVIPRFNKLTRSTRWTITRPILLPSNITIILDNCYMILADGVICNIFRNENIKTKKYGEGVDIDGIDIIPIEVQYNISILGRGYAVLDGGNANNILEANYVRENLPNPKNNHLILLSTVSNFKIQDIILKNQRYWAINIEYSSFGEIKDIYTYAKNSTPNQDGIHICRGCNDIFIQRISGQSGDDLVALTAIQEHTTINTNELIDKKDIHDISIRDIIGTSVRQAIIALRCQDESKMYNVNIENIIQSDNGDKNNFPYSANIRLGTNGYFTKFESPIGNKYRIFIKNVITSIHTAIVLCETLMDSKFENIRQISGWTPFYIDGVKIKNLKIKGVYVSPVVTGNPIFTENGQRENDFIDGMVIDNLVYEGKKKLTNLKIDDKTNVIVNGEKIC